MNTTPSPSPHAPAPSPFDTWRRTHIEAGWLALFLFAALGLALEGMHAFKLDAYLNVDAEMRRLLLRLAHAHGAFLALVQLAFAWTLEHTESRAYAWAQTASRCLLAALLLIPGGFFLGAWESAPGDPGLGVWLVPGGGLLLLVGLFSTAWMTRKRGSNTPPLTRD